jgi:dimethylhistidine N-methyltransferase
MGNYQFFDFNPPSMDMAEEVMSGLTSDPKRLSPKYFYDAQGSALFEEITELAEYYLTRTEMALFDRILPQVSESLGSNTCLIEYGSGSSRKIRKLLEVISPKAYVPVDISKEHLVANARELHGDFPRLHVYPVCADITQSVALPAETADLKKVAFFPGSSIGNFDPQGAVDFLTNVHRTVGIGGDMLIGVDRKKATQIIETAYNDKQGVTAAFNLNALAHINSKLEADFELEHFSHTARYNEALGCIQMFLRSEKEQTVNLLSEQVKFTTGEELHTENSYKYHSEEFVELAGLASFRVVAEWSDERQWFSLFLLEAI